jgi:transcription antitermination factor NusG
VKLSAGVSALWNAEPLPPPPGSQWWVIHTRPRCEKKAADHAVRQGASVLLPLQRRTHRYGARARVFESPLFPGYVFCCGPEALRSALQQSDYTANLLHVGDPAALVAQLTALRIALASGKAVEVMPYLQEGRRVKVVAGPLRGVEGLVLRVKNGTRIVLNLDLIRESVAVELESDQLAPA